jgi:myo-inositol-1(or 4)-monophosphatase
VKAIPPPAPPFPHATRFSWKRGRTPKKNWSFGKGRGEKHKTPYPPLGKGGGPAKQGRGDFRRILFLALRRAGALIRKNIDRPNKIQFKGGSPINLVTWVDAAADRMIRQLIQSRFPDHDLLTEESAPTAKHSPYKWIVDPLDGTTNYAHHFPQCCVSIALELRGEVVLAGVYDPFRDELFWAEKGRGAFLIHRGRSRRLRVSTPRRLRDALLLTGFPYDRRERADFYLSFVKAFLEQIQGIRRAGAAALDLCWVACGRVDGYWEWRLKPWDAAAGRLIVTEAGGTVSDFSGKPHTLYGDQTLATNGKVHREMLAVMKKLL